MSKIGRESGWKKWNADDAREALARWRASGQPISVYERRAGLSDGRLRWWQKRLEEWSETKTPVTEELRLVPVVTRNESASVADSIATLHLPGGASLEFKAGQVSAAWVAEVAVEATRWR